MVWMRIIGQPVRNANGRRVGATVALIDIDEEIGPLAEKPTLLDKVNRRVGNALQLMGSILSLQARGATRDSAGMLCAAAARMQAVVTAHATLYHDDDVRNVAFGGHLMRFCGRLAKGLGASALGVTLGICLEPVRPPAETGVPPSLIANELITDASRHAFASSAAEVRDSARRVELSFRRQRDRTWLIKVADREADRETDRAARRFGRGDVTSSRSDDDGPRGGLGTTLIEALARQIGAIATRETKD
jgi:two-component sensor histidine kinase